MTNAQTLAKEIEETYNKKCRPKQLLAFIMSLPELNNVGQGKEIHPKNTFLTEDLTRVNKLSKEFNTGD